MRKIEELSCAKSCINRARDNEIVFVLLARDPAAPSTIRFWIEERIRLGINTPIDRQVIDAEICAVIMEVER